MIILPNRLQHENSPYLLQHAHNPVDWYLDAARRADQFLSENMMDGDALYGSFRKGKHGVRGFLDDYAAYLFAQLALHGATREPAYLNKAKRLCHEADHQFRDGERGGYFFYGAAHEALILRPKETYDGAIPSGNSLMAWNLVRLSLLTKEASFDLPFFVNSFALNGPNYPHT